MKKKTKKELKKAEKEIKRLNKEAVKTITFSETTNQFEKLSEILMKKMFKQDKR